MSKDIVVTSAGVDYRPLQMSQAICRGLPMTPTTQGGGVTSDEIDAEIDRAIERGHCRRIEAATGGRLTFCGDRIVQRK